MEDQTTRPEQTTRPTTRIQGASESKKDTKYAGANQPNHPYSRDVVAPEVPATELKMTIYPDALDPLSALAR
jgi:hypothetical protein